MKNKQLQRKKAVLNWSGGKDSALALQKVLEEEVYEVVALLTVFREQDQTSSMHTVPFELMEKQAKSIGIELYPVFVNDEPGDYELKMEQATLHFKEKGVRHFIFGDLYIEGVRTYRESKLNPLGIEVVEPLWGNTPEQILNDVFNAGIKAKIITVQADKLSMDYIGKDLNPKLIEEFPECIDLCGENGEYHTFVYEGGFFKEKIEFKIEKIEKNSFDIRLDTGEVITQTYGQALLK